MADQDGQAAGAQPVNSDAEARIPKERLDKEIAKRRELENQLAALTEWKATTEAQTKQAEQKRLEEQGEFKRLAEERATQLAAAQAALAKKEQEQFNVYLSAELRARTPDIASPKYLALAGDYVKGVKFVDGEWQGLDDGLKAFREQNPSLFAAASTAKPSPSHLHPVAGQTIAAASPNDMSPAQRLEYFKAEAKKAMGQG